jgi:hypothetical protein
MKGTWLSYFLNLRIDSPIEGFCKLLYNKSLTNGKEMTYDADYSATKGLPKASHTSLVRILVRTNGSCNPNFFNTSILTDAL